jgi:hypothetical protein
MTKNADKAVYRAKKLLKPKENATVFLPENEPLPLLQPPRRRGHRTQGVTHSHMGEAYIDFDSL